MKKVIFGIFAHPDDEAFGPCGTLIKEVRDGADVHLFVLTYGGAGQNPDNVPNLATAREAEWRAAGAAIGARSLHGLNGGDGHLDNIAMQAMSADIEPMIRTIVANYHEPLEVEFITFEPNGLTGHIDHIVASRTASFLFHRLKDAGLPLARIRYYCNSEAKKPSPDTSWIFADKGRSEDEINETVDATSLRSEIIAVMECHKTQRADYERYLASQGDQLGIDHFIVAT